jgi:hypothetical protein
VLTAYQLNGDRTISEVAMGVSVDAVLADVTGDRRQFSVPIARGRIWIEDSRRTAQTLVSIDIDDRDDQPAGPRGYKLVEFTQLLNDAQNPDALRREAKRLRDESIALLQLADEIERAQADRGIGGLLKPTPTPEGDKGDR